MSPSWAKFTAGIQGNHRHKSTDTFGTGYWSKLMWYSKDISYDLEQGNYQFLHSDFS